MNATTTEQVTSRTDEWYTQLYLSIVDTLIGQLNMRFPQEMFAIARAVGAVFSCDVKGVDPLIRHYGSLLNINLPVLQAEMTLSGSTADAVSLEVIRSELNQHAVVSLVFQTSSVSSHLACWNSFVGEKFLCLETYPELAADDDVTRSFIIFGRSQH